MSSVSVMLSRSVTDTGAAEAEPAKLSVVATTQAWRGAAAPFVKSVPFTFSNMLPLARSKSAPFPDNVCTGTRSRTTMPPSFTSMESKRNFASYVSPLCVENTQRSMSG